jgi:hypothetical protein
MQTFLPFPCFAASACSLDVKRLGKQRVETWQIYLALTKPVYGWKNHPATRMWRGFETALLDYGIAICDEWLARGYNDTMRQRFIDERAKRDADAVLPPWFGDEQLHLSHQSNLVRKDRTYSVLFPDAPSNLPYVWPIKQ